MSLFFIILVVEFLGIVGHWWNRWAQGRTESTFMQYLKEYKAGTVNSFFSILVSSSTVFANIPEGISSKNLLLTILGAFCSAYMLDSLTNKSTVPTLPPELVKLKREVKTATEDLNEDKKSLNDIVRNTNELH